jgi:ligand-binding sensor domain-containing protein
VGFASLPSDLVLVAWLKWEYGFSPLRHRGWLRLQPAESYRVTALQEDYTGSLWVGSWAGLTRIDPETGRIMARVRVPSNTIESLAMDKVGRIWVGTYDGLVQGRPQNR